MVKMVDGRARPGGKSVTMLNHDIDFKNKNVCTQCIYLVLIVLVSSRKKISNSIWMIVGTS